LDVFDTSGRLVERIVNGVMEPGSHTVAWRPRRLAAGTYVAHLRSASSRGHRKLLIVK
jgi:hypothetical protein